ncbi:hypothetical protein QQF40_08325 [Cobetia sp. LC6]|uniref:hypothetical protein n=1 Tax=Cobetia sp. LC6 TaxID=3050947 RepID=UPI0025520EA4|nr:hypothetical protein [Cobetia sp. LC6]MDL2191399.1 hypothetical protein [Cobetia sp. LC6]
MTLRNPRQVALTAWVEEEEVLRVDEGATAWFYPLAPVGKPLEMRVVSVEAQAVAVLEQPEMAAPYGGDLKVREGDDGQLELMRSLYRVTLEPVDFSQALALSMPGRRGMVNVDTEPRSLLSRTWRQVVGAGVANPVSDTATLSCILHPERENKPSPRVAFAAQRLGFSGPVLEIG